MILELTIALLVGASIGWVGGCCFGYLAGARDTKQRWLNALAHVRASYDL